MANTPLKSPTDALVSAIEAPLTSEVASLWLVRHAEVEVKYQNVFGGRIDMELSARGHQQAAALAEYVNPEHVDVLYSSPMIRVQQTLAPLLKRDLPSPQILADLREVDFGVWTGYSWEQILVQFGVSPFAWLDQLEADAIAQAESGPRLRSRLHPILKQILEAHPNKTVLLACHGGVIRMILSILLDLPFSKMGMFEIDYASITKVQFQSRKTQLQLLNFTPWRDLPEYKGTFGK